MGGRHGFLFHFYIITKYRLAASTDWTVLPIGIIKRLGKSIDKDSIICYSVAAMNMENKWQDVKDAVWLAAVGIYVGSYMGVMHVWQRLMLIKHWPATSKFALAYLAGMTVLILVAFAALVAKIF